MIKCIHCRKELTRADVQKNGYYCKKCNLIINLIGFSISAIVVFAVVLLMFLFD